MKYDQGRRGWVCRELSRDRGGRGRQEQAEVNCAMVIEFLCPQGHKIRCGDDRAGKPARCPKCGVRFYVPGPDDSESSDSGSWATAPAETSNSPGSTGALKEQIEFLCPNGHRVWAPIALQGRAGQCPECGSKFHIPTLADYEDMPLDILPSEDSVVNLDPLTSLHKQRTFVIPCQRSPLAAGKPWGDRESSQRLRRNGQVSGRPGRRSSGRRRRGIAHHRRAEVRALPIGQEALRLHSPGPFQPRPTTTPIRWSSFPGPRLRGLRFSG